VYPTYNTLSYLTWKLIAKLASADDSVCVVTLCICDTWLTAMLTCNTSEVSDTDQWLCNSRIFRTSFVTMCSDVSLACMNQVLGSDFSQTTEHELKMWSSLHKVYKLCQSTKNYENWLT